MAKEYKKLNKVEQYDRDAAEELAEALNEIVQLERRVANLRELVEENKELHPFIWRTQKDVSIAIHKVEDDHLKNIMQHLVNTGRPISKAIRAEARSRGFDIPETSLIHDTYRLEQLAASNELRDKSRKDRYDF
jgi:hypothetical protein